MRRTASQPIGDDAEWARGVIARAWQSDIGSPEDEQTAGVKAVDEVLR